MNLIMSLVALIIFSITLVSCDSSEDSSDEVKVSKKAVIAGIDGAWSTDCIPSPQSSRDYQIIKMIFSGDKLSYNKLIYRDKYCSTRSVDGEKLSGETVVIQNLNEKIVATQFRIPINENVSATRDFNIKLEDDVIRISRFYNSAFKDPTSVPLEFRLKFIHDNDSVINNLETGRYTVISGNSDFCDHSVSTMKNDGDIAMVFVDLLGTCSGSLQFECEGMDCYAEGYKLSLLTNESYKIVTVEGEIAIFEKISN